MAQNIAITWRRIPERYRLDGTECKTCEVKFFPPRNFCPKCRRKGKIEPYRFSGRGKVVTYSEITAAPAGFELAVPYVLAIIELEECKGTRLTGQIVGVRDSDVKVGDKVEMVFRKIKDDAPEGLIHYGYKFRLCQRNWLACTAL